MNNNKVSTNYPKKLSFVQENNKGLDDFFFSNIISKNLIKNNGNSKTLEKYFYKVHLISKKIKLIKKIKY